MAYEHEKKGEEGGGDAAACVVEDSCSGGGFLSFVDSKSTVDAKLRGVFYVNESLDYASCRLLGV